MPEMKLQEIPADQEDGSTTSAPPSPPLVMLPEPDKRFGALSAEHAARQVIIHCLCDPDDSCQSKVTKWQSIPGITRLEIGLAALKLNKHCIDWKSFPSIPALCAAETALRRRLRSVNDAPNPQPEAVN